MKDYGPVEVAVADGVAQLTLSRPEARNAINPPMRRGLRAAVADCDADDAVAVMILTGADPAFCAGIDLKLLGQQPDKMLGDVTSGSVPPLPPRTKPLIGAINGPAVTGGFELALACDILIASERAAFADTHARVGVMPGWGLTALLTDLIGRNRAREMSLTGNFVLAQQAYEWGLVNSVVPHEDLLRAAHGLAQDIIDNDQAGVRQMLATYASQQDAALAEAWELESEGSRSFATTTTAGADVEARRDAIMARGRAQNR